MTVSLLSTSGANKSAILAELQSTVDAVNEYQGQPSFIATDYTIESLMALMGDTGGTALLLLDEMKKIKAVDEYKSSKQGSGNEKLMELQSGQKFRQSAVSFCSNPSSFARNVPEVESSSVVPQFARGLRLRQQQMSQMRVRMSRSTSMQHRSRQVHAKFQKVPFT